MRPRVCRVAAKEEIGDVTASDPRRLTVVGVRKMLEDKNGIFEFFGSSRAHGGQE